MVAMVQPVHRRSEVHDVSRETLRRRRKSSFQFELLVAARGLRQQHGTAQIPQRVYSQVTPARHAKDLRSKYRYKCCSRKPVRVMQFSVIYLLLLSLQATLIVVQGQDKNSTETINATSPTSSQSAVPLGPPPAPPTNQPTNQPTSQPTNMPSSSPTSIFRDQQSFRQGFVVPNQTSFFYGFETQIQDLFQNYTEQFAPGVNESVTSKCEIKSQQIQIKAVENTTDFLYTLELDYGVSYSSLDTNVSGYPDFFLEFMNNNLTRVSSDIYELVNFTVEAMEATIAIIMTEMPTTSHAPSISLQPSPMMTLQIIGRDPTDPAPPLLPAFPVTPPPLPEDLALTVSEIAGITVCVGLLALLALFFYYMYRKRRLKAQYAANAGERNKREQPSLHRTPSQDSHDSLLAPLDIEDGVERDTSPLESSPASNSKSLLSNGEIGKAKSLDKNDDSTSNFDDEFDRYKDKKIEVFRSNVEGNLNGFEGIMSAAVTQELIRNEKLKTDLDLAKLWGCHEDASGPEVEASVLCEVNNWLQRHLGATTERRRVFMQEILNKMVASVRCGVIEAADASRTIHESAALLNLSLANELPNTTVIINGMRKKATSRHLFKALREFGEIEVAAVASGLRGFGIVRFRHSKCTDRAMFRYRSSEIVVQDVAVQMRVLTTNGKSANYERPSGSNNMGSLS